MKSYMHRNSAVGPPTLTVHDFDALEAARQFPHADWHAITERLECERIARQLGGDTMVLDRVVYGHRYCEAAVRIMDAALDAEAASRVADRVRSGLSLSDALARTLEQCDCPELTEAQLVALEREADAQERRAFL